MPSSYDADAHDEYADSDSEPYFILDPTPDRLSCQTSPPNSPRSETSHPRRFRNQHQRKSVSLNLVHRVDLRAITYEGTVDENLICPICRCAFVQPLSTCCDHTFCRDCIIESRAHSDLCPVDRRNLAGTAWIASAKIICNQLDNLKTRCPCCQTSVPRSMLETHLEKYCQEALMRCPGKNMDQNCEERIKRKIASQGCLHFDVICPDCEETMLRIDLEDHRQLDCEKRFMECKQCGVEVIRCKEKEHNEECPMQMVPCKWRKYGCAHESLRSEILSHAESCSWKAIGAFAESMLEEIGNLRSEVRTLTETNQMQERRIKFLENGPRDLDRPMDLSELSNHPYSSLPAPGAMDSDADDYVMSLLESQENRLGQFSAAMNELEAKQTTMLFNETIPIKTELSEIRSMQQTTSMHVRWLMRFRMQENNRFQNRSGGVLGSGTNAEDSSAAGPSGESFPARRTSDSASRDLVTKL